MSESAAIRQSRARLAKARDALARLEASTSYEDSESAWSDFLISTNGVYSKLEQGSKSTGRGTAWFGRVKNVRKSDWLLSYMHHARNSEEHGLEDVTKRMAKGQATITIRENPGEPFDPLKLVGLNLFVGTDSSGNAVVKSSDETLVTTSMYDNDAIALAQVRDTRFNDCFNPPYRHKGVELTDVTPRAIGRLFVEYLAELIDDALKTGL